MKILVRATNWVGDAVMSLPALEAIRARQPQSEISILARSWVADLYRGQGFADRLLVLDDAGEKRSLIGGLRRERFDVAVLLPNSFASAWLVWRARIPERIGYARDGRSWLLTQAIPPPRPGETPPHESYYYLELLRRAGWLERPARIEEIRLRVEPTALARAEGMLNHAGTRSGARRALRLALAPGAAYGSAKCWPPERYAQLADRLIAEFDADVILFGAASEREVAARIVAEMKHRATNLAGETRIGDLPALFASCDLFIGNDSGAMHVAAVVGLPVVAIFGSTDPGGTRPVTPHCTIVQQRVSCSPCFLRECPVDHRCMTGIEVEAVYEAARIRILSRSGNRVHG
jgi:lipopolysaccharide heptosyltransferase II